MLLQSKGPDMSAETAGAASGAESPPPLSAPTAFQSSLPSSDRIACPRCKRMVRPKTLRYSHVCGPDACQRAAIRSFKAQHGFWRRQPEAEVQKPGAAARPPPRNYNFRLVA